MQWEVLYSVSDRGFWYEYMPASFKGDGLVETIEAIEMWLSVTADSVVAINDKTLYGYKILGETLYAYNNVPMADNDILF